MGSNKSRFLAELAGAAADFISAYPEAATFALRQLGLLLQREASNAEEREREDQADMRRRWYTR